MGGQVKRIAASVLMGVVFAAGVAGCGERDQSARYQNGKFRGKARQQTQNEYLRIGH